MEQALYVTALTLGMRQGEILGLQWRDLDLDLGMVAIRRTLVRLNGAVTFPEPKTERSRRVLWLPKMTVSALRAHHARQLMERLIAGSLWQDTGLVFTTETGEPLRDTSVTKAFQRVLLTAGLRHQRFHDLRHAAASFLLAQGFEMRQIMGILGHSSIALTANLYTHLMPAVKQEASARMDAMLSGV
ncbi:MAG: site-specific integrase [Dehalococcoidia bacterium]|nr:site-specific integrase [Dehalococcoidia bacterium]